MRVAAGLFLMWIGLWTLLDMYCGAVDDHCWWFTSPRRVVLGVSCWAALVCIFA